MNFLFEKIPENQEKMLLYTFTLSDMLKSGSSHRIGVCGSKYQISIDYL